MARGATSPAPSPLPKVSFTKVHDDFSAQPAGVADLQARSYGYNDGSSFRRPEHYIRYIEPLESELAVQVEYDMDEQDREWLESINAERKKDQQDRVSYEIFEIVMDRLEKEWFDLTKNIPKPDLAMPSEDSTCAICDDSEGENTNAIVFCDGCNLAVHQDCYGVPYIPEGQWLCRKCTVSPENPVSCILCPNEGGAFKQTVQGEWVHLLCAIWVPETRVANDVFMEPVTGVDRISKQRWKLKCSICDVREGACIQCIKTSCFLAFHATCARKEKFLMPMKATQGSEAPSLACYCERHLPREQAEARAVALALENGGESDYQKSSKTARAYAKTYKLGPPLVPKIIVDRIMQYINKVTIRQKREFVVMVCKYWSLKREARRGAPLLKRLHLEPWTASAGGRNQSEEDKIIKLDFLKTLKADMERARELANLSKKREVQKLLQARAIHDLICRTLLPFQPFLRNAFDKIVSYDRLDFFKNPVSKYDVPDYYDIIEQPICWNVIEKKLDEYEYLDLQDLKDDVYLVLSNAMLYNRPETQYYKTAQKIRSHAERILAELEQVKVPHPEVPACSADDSQVAVKSLLGDMEPSLEALQLLFQQSTVVEDVDFILETDPVSSLFSYELSVPKPAPPPPVLPPPKPKRDRKAEKERARQARQALDATAGFRARTRSSVLTDPGPDLSSDAMDVDAALGPPEPEEHPEGITDKKRGKRHKRPPIVLPGQTEVPPVVDEVDNQTMFSMFDGGWILPDGQRRRGRQPVDRPPLEPKRKKPKTGTIQVSHGPAMSDQAQVDRERSHLSTEGTAVAPEEQAGPSNVHLEVGPEPTADGEADVSADIQAEASIAAHPGEKARNPDTEGGTAVKMDVDQDEAQDLAPSLVEDRAATPGITGQSGEDASEPPSPHVVRPGAGPVAQVHQQSVDAVMSLREESASDNVIPQEGSEAQIADISTGEHVPPEEPLEESAAEQLEEVQPALEVPAETAPPEEEEEGQEEADEEQVEEEESDVDEPVTVIIIEELDTPATRREKHLRKKAERLRRATLGSAAETEADNASGPLAGPSQLAPTETAAADEEGGDAILDANSDLTSLASSEAGDRGESPVEGSATSADKGKMRVSEKERGKVVLERNKLLDEGTLVWAKTSTYPWWPAVVADVDTADAPEDLLHAVSPSKARKEKLHLVRFFDGKNEANDDSWNWVGINELRLFGEDAELDTDMVAKKSKRQRWRNDRIMSLCRKAHRRALAEMDVANGVSSSSGRRRNTKS